jgi:hypothetical protein
LQYIHTWAILMEIILIFHIYIILISNSINFRATLRKNALLSIQITQMNSSFDLILFL